MLFVPLVSASNQNAQAEMHIEEVAETKVAFSDNSSTFGPVIGPMKGLCIFNPIILRDLTIIVQKKYQGEVKS